MTMEGIVLAGGLGTRIRDVVPDRPKPMAPVSGRPFLEWVLDSLAAQGFARAILAVGHMRDVIQDHFGTRYRGMEIDYSVEETPLGTGGAIRQALCMASQQDIFVLNGDTYLRLPYADMMQAHRDEGVGVTMAVCAVDDVSRFGALVVKAKRIVAFSEKGARGAGLINAGVYILARSILDGYSSGARFSFENDFLLPRILDLKPLAYRTANPMLDIGVPTDYSRAGEFLRDQLS